MELGLRSFVHFTPMHHHHHTHTPPPTTTLFHHFSNNSLLFPACLTLLNTTSSSFMATHLQVSEGAPTEAFDPSPSLAIGEYDLLIVGPGILGRLVAHNWRQEYPGCKVFGQTATTNHHQELTEIGINPSLKWTKASSFKFPYVIFCAPPYQSPDYLGDLRLAASCWNGEGALLFTSSSAPYDCNDNGLCHEDNPVVPMGRSPRTDVLLKAEKIVLEFGGSVLRLSGLYKVDKGAHAYWLDKGIVESRPDHILNLIHYEDAASLSVAILKKQFHGRIFLGCDNHPLSRQEVMDLVYKSGKFSKKFEKFTGTDDPLGKRLNNSRTCQEVGWQPKYSSFAHFLETI
ncbi:hypothetical protein AAZX31_13G197000 [Glycine max]|uniref:uncharacterized protein isoform X1 n=1 Tax=Glycine max TaxID=3847 RepID=UPI001B35728A|nr:uncharacterized protein LOC100779953 isoform X1 [Glycine max]KAG4960226.1 hypothetical protein JHK87_036859 [Glycine soja]KAG4384108.1 hypothetical protein GLYMA_13G215300v4 [Glycine max]KAG4977645.1 hypothetical protein JHK86_037119 [Glycine max]KAG5113644.1 hypothetical protein JHK82_036913 [Glycine max]KAG5130921.1 hypothetical protein JHK84_037318 [Glycine max]